MFVLLSLLIYGINELIVNLSEVIGLFFREKKMKQLPKQFIVDETGKKTAVVLSLEEYEELLEDIHDLAVIAERRNEPTISFDELKKRLKTDGLI